MGGGDQVLQRGTDLGPAAGLQTAVRVDPQAFRRDRREAGAQQPRRLLGARHPGRVDVVHAGPGLPRVAVGGQFAGDLHVGTGGLQADHVGVEVVDGPHDVTELGVAHVGVDLGAGTHPAGAEPEGLGGPLQIGGPAGRAQRQGLAQRGFVDLDHGGPRGLQVGHLVAQREGDLAGGVREGLVVADEGPGQHGDRTREHALDRAVGEGLGVRRPAHGHRLRARDVTGQHGRTDVAGAVGLHPAVPGGQVPRQPLGEVLDHVVALGLAVHQHVQAGLLLEGDDLPDLRPDALLVALRVDPPGPQVGAGRTQLAGLREGADGGRRQRRQPQVSPLGGGALGVRLGAARVGRGDRAGAGADGGVPGDGGARSGGQVGAVRGEFGGDRAGAAGQALGEGDGLRRLLPGEGEPAQDLRLDVPLRRRVQRHVQQGAGGRHVHAVGQTEQGAERGQGARQVVHPDVAAVDDARDQALARQTAHGGQVPQVGRGGLGEVQRQPLDRRLGQDRQGVAQAVEVRGDEQPGTVGERAQITVGAGGGVEFGRRAVLDQGRLVELHPLRAGRAQVGEDLRVHRQQPVEEGEGLEARGGAGRRLGEQQVGDRADEHRAGRQTQRERLPQLRDLLARVGGEHRVRTQLRHKVVVVGVEPLGHLQRRHVLGAARHGEVPVERVGGHGVPVPRGDGADHDGGVQHVVVVREVAGGHLVDTGLDELTPVAGAQPGGGGVEGVGGDPALPVALDGLLQFPVGALARIAVHGGVHGGGRTVHGDLLRETNP